MFRNMFPRCYLTIVLIKPLSFQPPLIQQVNYDQSWFENDPFDKGDHELSPATPPQNYKLGWKIV